MGSKLSKQTRKISVQQNVIESESEYETDEGEEFVEINLKSERERSSEEFVEVYFNSEDEQSLDNTDNSTGGMDINTDAIESHRGVYSLNYPNPLTIKVDQVQYLEHKLDFYEKVALVFLLCDNVDVALQHLIIEESHEIINQRSYGRNGTVSKSSLNLISNWARSKHTYAWQNKLLEALCIIQNYAILEELGYDKQEMKIRFLPTNPYTSLLINLTRKVLYIICENLTKDKIMFLSYIRDDFKQKNITFQEYNKNYLELYFLKFFSERYIMETDMSNIITIFKQMGLLQYCDWLESIKKSNQVPIVNKEEVKSKSHRDNVPSNMNFDLNGEVQNTEKRNGFSTENSLVSCFVNNKYKNTECYKMDPKNPGICLIINQRDFYQETDKDLQIFIPICLQGVPLKTRDGTDVDRNRLESTFKKFNFKVIIKENCKHNEIKENIENTMKSFRKSDCCLVICILSHGLEASVFGVNSIPVDINDIEELIQSREYPNLFGKPKIIILQSCQGTSLQEVICCDDDFITTDSPDISNKKIKNVLQNEIYSDETRIVTDAPLILPEKSDLLTCYSTIPGYASIRNEIQGTWYIQELCEVLLREASQKHFADILSIVTGIVSRKKWYDSKTNKVVCMVPQIKSSFGKFLFFPAPENLNNEY